MRAQRGGEAEVVELWRPQAEREVTHALEGMLHGLDTLGDAPVQLRIGRALQRLQLDLQRRQRLPDVVVQVAREARALLLLHFQQPAGERSQALVRKLQLLVHPLERLLRTQALGDVVDHDQARTAAAPADQMADAVDVDRLAVLARVAEYATVDAP